MRITKNTLTYGLAAMALTIPQPVIAQEEVDFGDDSSMWANDDECDDKRFEGPGMTATPLLDEDVGHDATDCKTAYDSGNLTYRGDISGTDIPGAINWGVNRGDWGNDGECDDARFVGSGMASALVIENIGNDAADCKAAFDEDRLQLNPLFTVPDLNNPINFGDDTAGFANDGACDDVRFTGDYAATMIYLAEDIGHDASDCRNAVLAAIARWQGNDMPINVGHIPE